jgi:hypothetical protein
MKKQSKTQPEKAPALRLKLVRDRLKSLPSWPRFDDLSPSDKVRQAKKVVKAYDDANRAHKERQRAAYFGKKFEVEDAMIEGDFARALKLLHELEAKYGKGLP